MSCLNDIDTTHSLMCTEYAPTTFLNKKNSKFNIKIPKHPHDPKEILKKTYVKGHKCPQTLLNCFYLF